MSTFRPFRAVRPTAELADKVAALPYDVYSGEEAREYVKDKPYSFLHVDKAEIDLPRSTYKYDDAVYARAASKLRHMKADGVGRCVPAGRGPRLLHYGADLAGSHADRSRRLRLHR